MIEVLLGVFWVLCFAAGILCLIFAVSAKWD